MDAIGVTSFDATKELDALQKKAKNIVLHAETKGEKKELKRFLKSFDPYIGVYIYDLDSGEYITGVHPNINVGILRGGILPMESLMYSFEDYVSVITTNPYYRLIQFKDVEAEVDLSSWRHFKVSGYYFYFSIIVSVITFLIPTLVFIRRKIKYINILHEEVSIMEDGDLETTITVKGNDEIAALSKQIDSLRQALIDNIEKEAESRNANYELISAMSHDLRTPLTTLNEYLEIISLHKGNEKMYDEYLQRSLGKIEEIKDLSNKMLTYAQVYSTEEEVSIDTIEYQQWSRIIEENIEFIRLKGHSCFLENNAVNINILGNEPLIKRIFNNLFSNITKYSDIEETITITCIINKEQLEIVITNHKSKNLEKVESNSIGLKSVKKMMKTLYGDFFVVDEGTLFAVTLRFWIR